jgi:hypothetical protein
MMLGPPQLPGAAVAIRNPLWLLVVAAPHPYGTPGCRFEWLIADCA